MTTELMINREYNAKGTAAQCEGRSGTELATRTGFPAGIWIDYEWDGISPRAKLFASAPDLVVRLAALVAAASELLGNACDNGECFIDEEDERYDHNNPEQMYPDWAELSAETDRATALLNILEPTEK